MSDLRLLDCRVVSRDYGLPLPQDSGFCADCEHYQHVGSTPIVTGVIRWDS